MGVALTLRRNEPIVNSNPTQPQHTTVHEDFEPALRPENPTGIYPH